MNRSSNTEMTVLWYHSTLKHRWQLVNILTNIKAQNFKQAKTFKLFYQHIQLLHTYFLKTLTGFFNFSSLKSCTLILLTILVQDSNIHLMSSHSGFQSVFGILFTVHQQDKLFDNHKIVTLILHKMYNSRKRLHY